MPRIPVLNLGASPEYDAGSAPLPTPALGLYKHPNPDGTRKNCGNCIQWMPDVERCAIHPQDLKIDSDEWCGYHMFGPPSGKPHKGVVPVTPDISGLKDVGAGAACGGCKFYTDQGGNSGLCSGISNPDTRKPPVQVDTYAACARYEGI